MLVDEMPGAPSQRASTLYVSISKLTPIDCRSRPHSIHIEESTRTHPRRTLQLDGKVEYLTH